MPLLSLATPACFAGNCKPDPPPSPRLGGGCVLGFAEANIAGTTDFVDGNNGSYGNYGNNGNVAIKRGQRLLADYAEREQRKDCEAGLIMGV